MMKGVATSRCATYLTWPVRLPPRARSVVPSKPRTFWASRHVLPQSPEGIARGFGWQAESVAERSDLEGALRRMIDAKGPALLDVQVPYQEHVLPMIPSGGTVRDLIKR